MLLFVWGQQCYTYIRIIFFITLQEKINTVRVGVENVGEEDCIKIETEEDYIQLVRTVKIEQEARVFVGVLCGSEVFTGVFACVLYCTMYLVTQSFSMLYVT